MAEATIHQTTATRKVSKWARIKEMFAEMDQILAEIKRDQEETDRMRVEIRANLDKLDQMLSGASVA